MPSYSLGQIMHTKNVLKWAKTASVFKIGFFFIVQLQCFGLNITLQYVKNPLENNIFFL